MKNSIFIVLAVLVFLLFGCSQVTLAKFNVVEVDFYTPGTYKVELSAIFSVPDDNSVLFEMLETKVLNVVVDQNRNLEFQCSWSATIPPDVVVATDPDQGNPNINLSDSNGKRYHMTDSTGAAANGAVLVAGSTDYGSFFFPPVDYGITYLIFHNDDWESSIYIKQK